MNLIFCVDKDNLFGLRLTDGTECMPWGVSNVKDLKLFQTITLHHPILMGYHTWLSIGKLMLKDRVNIVISKEHYSELKQLETNDFKVFDSPNEAILYAKDICGCDVCRSSQSNTSNHFYIIGGKSLIDNYGNQATKIYRTIISNYVPYIGDDKLIKEKIYVQSINTSKFKLESVEQSIGTPSYRWEIWTKIK